MSRGVSPFIAVVLLVAFTVGIGIIVYLFLSGTIKITTETTESMTETLLRCANARMYILGTPTCSSNPSYDESSVIEENLTIIILQDKQFHQNGYDFLDKNLVYSCDNLSD